MGLLTAGTPLSWVESAQYRDKVKRDGITQFLNAYAKTKDRVRTLLKWGDEVEYSLVYLDPETKTAKLDLRAAEVIAELQKEENAMPPDTTVKTLWRPEYANWMVEGTPGTPYSCYVVDLLNVESNMRLRRATIEQHLQENEVVLALTAFPRIGCKHFTYPPMPVFGKYARSFYTSDQHINKHPRFPTLSRNIRLRRGSKVSMRMPLFIDDKTPETIPIICDECDEDCLMPPEEVVVEDSAYDRVDDVRYGVTDDVYMDSTAFGMGLSCLQVTLQARDVDECRQLYDQLNVLAPLMLALTAATPAVRGYLLDTDVRWNIIAGSVDDRTPEERAGKINKSRYDSIDLYISRKEELIPERYNDIPVAADKEAYKRLIDAGIDERLALHIAHLYIRDPLVIYEDRIEQDNETEVDHFENIQSTNWNTVRFKPPPPESDIGWRTEFRSMEVQLTDFENAAFSVFVVLVSRIILAFDLNLYMPISKVDENMATAHERDAAVEGKFWFRSNIFGNKAGSKQVPDFVCSNGHVHDPEFAWPIDFEECDDGDDSLASMTLDKIFNGTPLTADGSTPGFAFPGLIPLVKSYLGAVQTNTNECVEERLYNYLDFIAAKAKGDIMTPAKWMRTFIQNHPNYNHDSRISEDINYDLMNECLQVSKGMKAAPELLGNFAQQGGPCGKRKDIGKLMMESKDEEEKLRGASLSFTAKERAFHNLANQ